MTLTKNGLAKIRKDAKYSQELMADLMQIEQTTYSRLENGKIKLKMEHASKIAKAVGKPLDEVMSQLSGCTFNNSINDTSENNQNIGVYVSDTELMQQLLASKDEIIKTQATTIHLLQAELERLKKM